MLEEIRMFLRSKKYLGPVHLSELITFTDGTKFTLGEILGDFTNLQLKKHQENILEIVKEMIERNPYPVDIFTEPSKEEKEGIYEALKAAGISSERVFGEFGRNAYHNALKGLIEQIEGEL